MLNRIEFWIACIEYGVKPWQTTASTIAELDLQRRGSAKQLEAPLYAFMKQRNGDNIGIDSEIAVNLIRAGIQTEIETHLGRRWGTRYSINYQRSGEYEMLLVRISQPIDIPGGVLTPVGDISLRDQRNIKRLLPS